MSTLLQGINVAVRNQVGRELYDFTDKYHSFLSILMGMDKFYGTTSRFMKSSDITGPEVQVDFRASLPVVQGASAVTGSLSGLELETQQNFSTIAGTMGWSYYQFREDVRRSYIEHIAGNKTKLSSWVQEVSKAIRTAINKKINDDLFPATGVDQSTGYFAENKIMSLAYPLQDPSSGTYSYLGINLNDAAYEDIKAVSSGTTGSAFGVMSPSNLRTKILLPMRDRGAQTDIVLCDANVYDYICTVAEAKIQLQNAKQLEYGGEYIKYLGLNWVYESKLDDLYASTGYREAYFLDSSTWCFTQKGFTDSSFRTEPHDKTDLLVKILGSFVCQLMCHEPRKNARAYNISLS